jgi:uncharacterized protein (TIGR02611 family)
VQYDAEATLAGLDSSAVSRSVLDTPSAAARWGYRREIESMRIAKALAGFLLLAAGVVMLVLPGPGWITIFAGLALLASEFEWAERLLDRLKAAVHRIRRGSRQ